MEAVYEQCNTHLSVYPLINDEPDEPAVESVTSQRETKAQDKEESAFGKALSRGKEKSEAYKAQKAQEPAAEKKPRGERS
jgi:hypothetical protein